MHNSLSCAACGLAHDADRLQNLCDECGKPLLVGYDLPSIKDSFTPDAVRSRAIHSMWRFHEVLPVDDAADAVTLGEGNTPLLKCRRVGAAAAFENLFVKDEALDRKSEIGRASCRERV